MDSWSGHKCVYRLVLATVLKYLTPSPSCQQCKGRMRPILPSACSMSDNFACRNEMVSHYGVNIAPQLRG